MKSIDVFFHLFGGHRSGVVLYNVWPQHGFVALPQYLFFGRCKLSRIEESFVMELGDTSQFGAKPMGDFHLVGIVVFVGIGHWWGTRGGKGHGKVIEFAWIN